MSGSVDQRTKGQSTVSNGPSSKENDFDYMQAPPSQGYGSAPMSSPNVSDPYYYPQYMFPNPNHSGVNDGTSWSTGGDPMSFLGGYPGQMGSDYMSSNMFGFDYSQPNFGWGYSGGDYNSTWGTGASQSQAVRKTDERAAYADGYSYMGGQEYVNGEVQERDTSVKAVEHSLKSMNLSERQDGRDSRQTSSGGGSSGGSSSGGVPQRTWASIAKQPARPQPAMKAKGMIPRAPVLPSRHNMDIGTWDNKNSANKAAGQATRQAWGAARPSRPTAGPYAQAGSSPVAPSPNAPSTNNSVSGGPSNSSHPSSSSTNGTITNPMMNINNHPILDKLKAANQYNPKNFNMAPDGVRFFIIKSYSEDDIHRSIKYGIWCSTEHGNKRLDQAFREREGKGPLYLLYSVNGSGHFCGMAQMMSPVDYNALSGVWAQDKWKGQFEVKWIYVKDVPNSQLRHIRLENNENKPVTNSRDTQEVPPEKGKQVLRILHQYRHTTSIFDDFSHYEKRQEEDTQKPEESQHERGDRDRERGDRERGDRERGDRERGDRERGDRDRGDRDRGDRERGDRDRGDRDRGERGDQTDRSGDRSERGDRGGDRRRPRNPQH